MVTAQVWQKPRARRARVGRRAWGDRGEGAVLGLPPSCPSPAVSAQAARSVLFLDVTHSNTCAEKSESTAAQKALI